MDPIEAASAFIEDHFPECLCAFVSGSVIRGEGTPTSDLDIVIVSTRNDAPFRESFRERGWPIETFVHTAESYKRYFVRDGNRPSLATMCADGVVIRDTEGLADKIKAEARSLLQHGPESLTDDAIALRRYGLTDTLDDFLGCDKQDEGILIAAILVRQASDLFLLPNHYWTGDGKWVPRALARFNPSLAARMSEALITYCRTGDKEGLVSFAEDALDTVGGRLFEGYYSRGQTEKL